MSIPYENRLNNLDKLALRAKASDMLPLVCAAISATSGQATDETLHRVCDAASDMLALSVRADMAGTFGERAARLPGFDAEAAIAQAVEFAVDRLDDSRKTLLALLSRRRGDQPVTLLQRSRTALSAWLEDDRPFPVRDDAGLCGLGIVVMVAAVSLFWLAYTGGVVGETRTVWGGMAGFGLLMFTVGRVLTRLQLTDKEPRP